MEKQIISFRHGKYREEGFTKVVEIASNQIWKRCIWLEVIADKSGKTAGLCNSGLPFPTFSNNFIYYQLSIKTHEFSYRWIVIAYKKKRVYLLTVSILALNFNKWNIFAFRRNKLTCVYLWGFFEELFLKMLVNHLNETNTFNELDPFSSTTSA